MISLNLIISAVLSLYVISKLKLAILSVLPHVYLVLVLIIMRHLCQIVIEYSIFNLST